MMMTFLLLLIFTLFMIINKTFLFRLAKEKQVIIVFLQILILVSLLQSHQYGNQYCDRPLLT